MRRLLQWTGTALVAAIMIAACGGGNDSTSNTPTKTIAKDPVQSGDAQTAVVATAPSDSLG
jgi:predicted outer membrane protein